MKKSVIFWVLVFSLLFFNKDYSFAYSEDNYTYEMVNVAKDEIVSLIRSYAVKNNYSCLNKDENSFKILAPKGQNLIINLDPINNGFLVKLIIESKECVYVSDFIGYKPSTKLDKAFKENFYQNIVYYSKPLAKKEREQLVNSAFYRSEQNNIRKTTTQQMGPYLQKVQSKISLNWKPPKTKINRVCIINFKININGRFTPPEITKTSGSKEFDNMALEAVTAAGSFPPLPSSYREKDAEVVFYFQSEIIKKKSLKNLFKKINYYITGFYF